MRPSVQWFILPDNAPVHPAVLRSRATGWLSLFSVETLCATKQ